MRPKRFPLDDALPTALFQFSEFLAQCLRSGRVGIDLGRLEEKLDLADARIEAFDFSLDSLDLPR